MGLFDYVTCERTLPDGFLDPRMEYQTKDTIDCYLNSYVIAEDGRLLRDGEIVAHHGVLEFSASNVSGSCGHGYITEDGQPAWFRSYIALYDHGRLVKIEGGLDAPDPLFAEARLMSREDWFRPCPSHGRKP